MNNLYIFIIVGILILCNIYVSYLLYRKDDLDRVQKISQAILVWLFPLLGAIGIWQFNREDDIPKRRSRPFGGGSNDSINTSSSND